MRRIIKVGSRKSDLAMAQTNFIITELKKIDSSFDYEIVPISTKGDEILDKPLLEFGGKGVFIDAFETLLLEGKIDLAVHSAKDMPTEIPKGLGILGVPKREDPRDVLISKVDLEGKVGYTVGTGSLRRQLQVKSLVDVNCENLRGNVPTRLNTVRDGKFEAIILAKAGLNRLNLDNLADFHYRCFSTEEFIPAGGQGILAVEGRIDDEIVNVVKKLDDENTRICLESERLVLQYLNASCNEMIGVYSYINQSEINISAIYDVKGKITKVKVKGDVAEYIKLSKEIAERLKNE